MKKKIKDAISLHANLQTPKKTVFKPIFYRIHQPKEAEEFYTLLNSLPNIDISENIIGQLKELVKIDNASSKFSDQQLEKLAYDHIAPYTLEEYGVWVYYPWSNRLVHILDEEEFIKVRTSRNQYKITPEERDLLGGKKIGVIGLSVGQSVSMTLAMERIGGELRLADFDSLELTNLNRIRTGVHNLGLPKVYAVAREISEIDPFLKVICFPEGLNELNMNAFFTEGGNLDLLIEESDGFDIKILSRYKAKELRIPVIMEASDRCTVDVERFDIEPERSILHGIIDYLDVNTLKSLKTTEEKIPYLLDIVGLKTSSSRLKASMLEIDQTINTWPQLASAVTMGGGITADVSRRMLLNQFTDSGRYHVDIEEIIGNKTPTDNSFYKTDYYNEQELTLSYMSTLIDQVPQNDKSVISDQDLRAIVEAGIIAPSAGNNQPWKWVSKNNVLYLFHDKIKSVSWADYDNLISNISFGTALENISLKSNELNYKIIHKLFPLAENAELVAAIYFTKADSSLLKDELSSYINIRHTNRKKSNGKPFNFSVLSQLEGAIQNIKNATLSITSDTNQIKTIADIVSASEQIRFLHPQAHYDFFSKELKWPENSQKKITEGLDVKTLELSLSQEVGLKVASEPSVIELLNHWNKGNGFKKLSYEMIASSSAVGIITMPFFDRENWIEGGKAVQRVWLMASKLGLAFQPISAPLFLYLKLKNEGGDKSFSKENKNKLIAMHQQLKSLFSELETREGVFLFRLSLADKPTTRSLRQAIEEMYFQL